jgi:secreted trypsin-like serine protease
MLKIFFVFFLCIAKSLQDCGAPQISHGFIAGGEFSRKGEWPWMASLMKYEGNIKLLGGASIISKNHLLTGS